MSSKKATKAQAAEQSYKVKDVVLAKVKGYPPWPAMVVDPESVAKHVKKERPMSKKTTFYCVRFFPAGDYSWAVAKDLSLLQTHEIEAYISEPSKKNSELKRGYEIALSPSTWEEDLLRKQEELEAAVEEEEEGLDQLEESDAGEEELESDGSGSAKKKKKSVAGKKRKRDSASNEDQKKKRKSAQEALTVKRRPLAGNKRASKSKASSTENVESEDGGDAAGEGEDGAESSGKKASGKGPKGRASDADDRGGKRGKKDKEEEEPEDAALANDPDAQRVKEWRHKLQRAFLTGKPPQPADMPGLNQIFTIVEEYPNLTIEYLQFSKIGKVMRRIAGLEDVPRDEEFHFKDRASKLVTKWQDVILEAEKKASQPNGKPNSAAPKEIVADVPMAAIKDEAATKKINGVANGATTETEMVNGETKEAPAAAATAVVDDSKDEAMDMSDS